LLFRTNFMKRV